MFSSIKPILNQYNVKMQNLNEDATAHWCWFTPLINSDTFMYAAFRDPVLRTISQFANQAKQAIKYSPTPYKISDINKKSFHNWLYTDFNKYKNVQSKCLLYYNPDHSSYLSSTGITWKQDEVPEKSHYMFDDVFINQEINKDLLMSNFNRINLKVNTVDLSNISKQKKILKNILNAFEIKEKINISNIKNVDYSTGMTLDIFNSLTSKEKQSLYEHQDSDSELFFSL
jgi:hypothetical protein